MVEGQRDDPARFRRTPLADRLTERARHDHVVLLVDHAVYGRPAGQRARPVVGLLQAPLDGYHPAETDPEQLSIHAYDSSRTGRARSSSADSSIPYSAASRPRLAEAIPAWMAVWSIPAG